jgi:hypothetical protein
MAVYVLNKQYACINFLLLFIVVHFFLAVCLGLLLYFFKKHSGTVLAPSFGFWLLFSYLWVLF